MNKTILVTGGYGFIGSHVIEELLHLDDIDLIINIDKLGVGSDIKNIPENKKIINYIFDLCDFQKLIEVFEKYKPSHIIHLAAESHVDRSISTPTSFVFSNVIGTTNILECIRLVTPKSKMIHVSTDEVYGHLESLNDKPFVETTPLSPRSPYSSSKASSDLIALSYHSTYGMNVTVTRCCNNYGPRQANEKFIPTIIKSIANNKKIPVYGSGMNIREWIYVKDHARALIELCFGNFNNKVYNIYGFERMNNLSLIDNISSIIEKQRPDLKQSNYHVFVDDRKGHDFCYAMSTNYPGELKTLLNQKDNFEKTVSYYLNKFILS